jgi:cysteine dioxygenase
MCRQDAFEVLVLCWENGQRSPIHDHLGSSCAMKIIAGRATESRVEAGENGMIYPTRSIEHEEGTLTGSQDDDIHQVSNLQGGGKQLITMHIYSPPLISMNVYYLHEGNGRSLQYPDPRA